MRTELGLDPAPLDVRKYDPDQPRVPAGSGRESGQWQRIWDGINAWFNDPVPVYDGDTGIQYGTRSRGEAIATNPVTVGVAGASAFLAVEAAAAATSFALLSATAKGFVRQDRVLQELGLVRNNVAVKTDLGRSIPDALTKSFSIEIKDRAYVSFTKQLRSQTEAAEASAESMF